MKSFTETDEDNGFLAENNIIIPGGKLDSDENPEYIYDEKTDSIQRRAQSADNIAII